MKYFAVFFVFIFFTYSCSEMEQEKAIETPVGLQINPNGDSELALLMREMFEDLLVVKTAFKENTPLPEIGDYSSITTAIPTEDHMKNDQFEPFALGFLHTLDQFKQADESIKLEKYNNAVDACISCHDNSCPGPIRRINKLYLRSTN